MDLFDPWLNLWIYLSFKGCLELCHPASPTQTYCRGGPGKLEGVSTVFQVYLSGQPQNTLLGACPRKARASSKCCRQSRPLRPHCGLCLYSVKLLATLLPPSCYNWNAIFSTRMSICSLIWKRCVLYVTSKSPQIGLLESSFSSRLRQWPLAIAMVMK